MKLGVVLGGGGVLCAAELGVLQALAEWNVKPDVLTGNSGGGIVAGALAGGVPLDGLIVFLRGVCGFPGRYALEEIGRMVDLMLPERCPGLLTMQPMLGELMTHGSRARLVDWPAGYGVTATSLSSGGLVALTRACGLDLLSEEAMQATSAFPGLFAGVHQGADLLIDGGILDNVPGDLAATLGADRLIVCTFDSAGGGGAPIGRLSVPGLLRAAVDVAIAKAQRAVPPLPQVVIRPVLPTGADLLSFRLFEPLRLAGYAAARAQRTAIEQLLALPVPAEAPTPAAAP